MSPGVMLVDMPRYRPSAVVLRAAPPAARRSSGPPITAGPQDEQLIRVGRVAWRRVRDSVAGTFESWVAIGRAIRVGQRLVLSLMSAKVGAGKRPFGGAFNRMMGAWLAENGFDDIDPVTRHDAVWIVDYYTEVAEWRDSLPECQRVRLNAPGYVRKEYLAAQQGLGRRGEHRNKRQPAAVLADAVEALRPFMPDHDNETIRDAVLAMWPTLRGPVHSHPVHRYPSPGVDNVCAGIAP
jgi:hypothetical protein